MNSFHDDDASAVQVQVVSKYEAHTHRVLVNYYLRLRGKICEKSRGGRGAATLPGAASASIPRVKGAELL